MRKNLRNNLKNIFVLAFSMIVLVSACRKKDQTAEAIYTCAMHTDVVKHESGSCPICGMDLVLKTTPSLIENNSDSALLKSMVSEPTYIKTITPSLTPPALSSTLTGIITYDTRTASTIPVRVSGRIEKLYINYNFQPIHKGYKILDIYSTELIASQRELIHILKNKEANQQVIDGARQRLVLAGMSSKQIEQLVMTKHETYSFTLYSNSDGYIIQNSTSQNDIGSNPLSLREGMYVAAGQSAFSVVNASALWAEFDVPQQTPINVNDSIYISGKSQTELKATVSFIQPFFKDNEAFTKVRVNVNNQKKEFRPGDLINGSIRYNTPDGLWIPISASVHTGVSDIVFIKRGHEFVPIKINAGIRSKNWLQVKNGLQAEDTVAVEAHFLTDNESFIKVVNK